MNNMGGFQRKASVVFYLTDSFNGAPVKSGRIAMEGNPLGASYVNKKDGYYVLSNMPTGDYTFNIEADNYLACRKEISLVPEKGPAVEHVNLQHAINSRLIDEATRIKACVKSGSQKPLAATIVTVAVITPVVYGRLAEKAEKGQDAIRLFCRDGSMLEGRQLFVFSRENEEILTINAYQREEDTFLLHKKLNHDYNSGTPLYLIWSMQTDNNGEFILPLPDNLMGGDNRVEFIIWHEKKKARKKLALTPGRISPLAITLKNQKSNENV